MCVFNLWLNLTYSTTVVKINEVFLCSKCVKQVCWLGLFFFFHFLLKKSIQLLYFVLFMWVVPLLYVLHTLLLRLGFWTTNLFQCGKERGIFKSWFAHIFNATYVFGHEYPTPKYFSVVWDQWHWLPALRTLPSVQWYWCYKSRASSLCSAKPLPHSCFPSCDPAGGTFSLDCCREVPCQSFILLPWAKLREDPFEIKWCLPKGIILHRMCSCLLEGGVWEGLLRYRMAT